MIVFKERKYEVNVKLLISDIEDLTKMALKTTYHQGHSLGGFPARFIKRKIWQRWQSMKGR